MFGEGITLEGFALYMARFPRKTLIAWLNKEVFVKHEKAPTTPRFEGVLTISYMPMFWKITAFVHFWPTSGIRKCQKAHLQAKTVRYKETAWKSMFRKTAIFGHFR